MFAKRNRHRRGLRLESLENRMLLASDSLHNFLSPHDVNDDSQVSPIDVLVVINHLNRRGVQDDSHFVDVNDDGQASPLDALVVINAMRFEPSRDRGADDVIAQLNRDDGVRVKFEYEVEDAEAKLEVKVQNAAANTDYAVLIDSVMIGTLTTNSRGRGGLELGSSRGTQPLPSNLPAIRPGSIAEIFGIGESSFVSSSSSNLPPSSSSTSTSTSTSTSVGSVLELKANLSGDSSIEARASFERTPSSVEFKVELRNAPPNTSYNVDVAGTLVGTLQTDNRGRGKLAFELGDNSKPFPSVFPTIEVGTTIAVGHKLAGTFRRDSN